MKNEDLIMQQELPDQAEALKRALASLEAFEHDSVNMPASVAGGRGSNRHPLTTEACACHHLEELFPEKLDLTFRRKKKRSGSKKDGADEEWILENPVHALHLSSQISQKQITDVDSLFDAASFPGKEEPIFYGEEHERFLALRTEGFPESWHPWIMPDEGSSDEDVTIAVPPGPNTAFPSAAAAAAAAKLPSTSKDLKAKKKDGLGSPSMFTKLKSDKSKDLKLNSISKQGASPKSITTPKKTSDKTKSSPSKKSGTLPEIVGSKVDPVKSTKILPLSRNLSKDSTPKKLPDTTPSASPSSQSTTGQLKPSSQTLYPPGSILHPQHQHQQHLLPETAYWSWHAAEEHMRAVRRAFLSKRAAIVVAPKNKVGLESNAVDVGSPSIKRRKPNEKTKPSVSLQQLAGWKHRHIHYFLPHGNEMPLSPTSAKKTGAKQPFHSSTKGSAAHPPPGVGSAGNWKVMTPIEEQRWKIRAQEGITKVALLLENYRTSREAYWIERRRVEKREHEKKRQEYQKEKFSMKKNLFQTFGVIQDPTTAAPVDLSNNEGEPTRYCNLCNADDGNQKAWLLDVDPSSRIGCCRSPTDRCQGDELMQCLECSFVGCAPAKMLPREDQGKSNDHILQHLLLSRHQYAVSCGPNARIYCFKCGDFVYHRVFEQEKERLDLMGKLPSMAWKEHALQRSFDAFQFFRVQDQGVFWRGMKATYPLLVPPEHVEAAKLCLQRQVLFQGQLDDLPLLANRQCIEFAALQNRKPPRDRHRISAPIGLYNLGHTCAMSSVLQCLINCSPLQHFFLRDIGHHHEACQIYRRMSKPASTTNSSTIKDGLQSSSSSPGDESFSAWNDDDICLACELDLLYLNYFSSTVGLDVLSAANKMSDREEDSRLQQARIGPLFKGQPLLTSSMLAAAWRCRGMRHLAGYDQRDAHEFFHAFMDNMGKDIQKYRSLVKMALKTTQSEKEGQHQNPEQDEIKRLFEGTLRSVLICQDCGNKRVQLEPFMSISLPLSKEVQKLTMESSDSMSKGKPKLSVERCLKHFTLPELLADSVDCPSCGKKTATKKQHVFSRLPKVLCLHLKRFDATYNKKNEDFVSFPGRGLNMGPYLPHWSEVSRVPTADENINEGTLPNISYDLFGTVNHFGVLQSGHYVANVRVKNRWYHCNDSFIGIAGAGKENEEEAVLQGDGAYLLFYIRK